MVRVARLAAALVVAATTLSLAQTRPSSPMNTIAERYVKLVLALGQHDADYVDAFYGPAEWKAEAARRKQPLAEIGAAADRLIAELPPRAAYERDDNRSNPGESTEKSQ